jgi:hypothetical protein
VAKHVAVLAYAPLMQTETRPYTGDPFTISADGHYIGQDGYVVPRDFAEFYEQQPYYVRRWASKWLHMSEDDDAVRDWEQDLLLYLHHLPEVSKSRKPTEHHPAGRTDVIQCFDPYRQYGAGIVRFRNFLNICLHNRSLTFVKRISRNPDCRKDNLSFGTTSYFGDEVVIADEEYIHSHSEILKRRSDDQASMVEKYFLVKRFMEYVQDHQPEVIDTLLAIAETKTLQEAQEVLQIGEDAFTRDRRRILQLKEAFEDGGPVRKQRKVYKRRVPKLLTRTAAA